MKRCKVCNKKLPWYTKKDLCPHCEAKKAAKIKKGLKAGAAGVAGVAGLAGAGAMAFKGVKKAAPHVVRVAKEVAEVIKGIV